MTSLNVNLDTKHIATIFYDSIENTFSFTYEEAWIKEGYEISPHLLFNNTISSSSIKNFLDNLLPEGKGLDDLTTFSHLSKNNIFGLIHAIGLETSGALHFGQLTKESKPCFRPITKEELTERIDEIESTSIIIWDKKPRLSLAGVQEKLPVLLKDGVLGLADGNLSSTHILKFQTKRNAHIVINEYFCMSLAKQSGLNVAVVNLHRYGTHPVLMVERFDRLIQADMVKRLHIIDGCQLLNLPSAYKYERNFGSSRDVSHVQEGASFSKLFKAANICSIPVTAKLQLLDWAIYTLIIGNADAHGKNISFFVSPSGIEVAPYYDMLSIIMHENVDHELAMAFGDEFDIDKILGYPLREFSQSSGLNPKLVSTRIKTLCNKVQKTLDAHTIELAILNDDEQSFILDLEKLITLRIIQLINASEEMLMVSY
ncbi:MAG: HipA domain-containing protein [Sulfurovum sp.]|nr:HipA domain-containing protein [Sulfurovum sp.]